MKKRPPSNAERWRRPTTRDDAVKQIEAVYECNNWSDEEGLRHRELIGLKPRRLLWHSNEDLKMILADFEKHKMIAYQK